VLCVRACVCVCVYWVYVCVCACTQSANLALSNSLKQVRTSRQQCAQALTLSKQKVAKMDANAIKELSDVRVKHADELSKAQNQALAAQTQLRQKYEHIC